MVKKKKNQEKDQEKDKNKNQQRQGKKKKEKQEAGKRGREDLLLGEKTAAAATFTTFFLAVIKAVIGFFTGSVVVLADALHTGVDIITIFSAWFSLKLAGKEPTEKFPYGFFKAETLASLLVSAVIIFASVELLIFGWKKLFILSQPEYLGLALLAPIISIIASLFIYYYENKIGKKINSQALISNAHETFMDILSSGLVFIALILAYFRIPYVEGIAIIVIAFLILRIGWQDIKSSGLALMDVSPGKQIENRIKRAISEVRGVSNITDLKLRRAGPFILGEVSVEISGLTHLKQAHQVTEVIESKVKKAVPKIETFTVHVEPKKPKRINLVIPVMEKKGLNSKISHHFGRANYFTIITLEKNKLKKQLFKKNPFVKKSVRAGISAIHFLLKAKPKINAITTEQIGEISFHTLRDNFISVFKTRGKTVKEVIDNYIHGKLELLEGPTKSKD